MANSKSADTPRARMPRLPSHIHYHTFPTAPPQTPIERSEPLYPVARNASISAGLGSGGDGDPAQPSEVSPSSAPPIPTRQLAVILLLSLSEQTALNSIQTYLPAMVASFGKDKIGLYVGLLGSAFALAQLATTLAWGVFSDTVGRKPVMILGTLLLTVSFALFGFCSTFAQAMAIHVIMGAVNANAAIVPSILGDMTDRSNQSKAFAWLPTVYSIGGISGPALGLLVDLTGRKYPFLGPNLVSVILLGLSVCMAALFFQETRNFEATSSRSAWVVEFFRSRICKRDGQMSSDCRGSSHKSNDGRNNGSRPDEETALLADSSTSQGRGSGRDVARCNGHEPASTPHSILNYTSILIFTSYLIFNLANMSFMALYPIFAEDSEPAGRSLSPRVVGVSLSVAGVVAICFQLFLFEYARLRYGNLSLYRWTILGLAGILALLPLVSYKTSHTGLGGVNSYVLLAVEIGFILVARNICAVAGLSTSMILITNSAPSDDTLGTINGIAQSISAAGRSFGPFVAGTLYAETRDINPKMAFFIFAGITTLGWIASLFIRGAHLESLDHHQYLQEQQQAQSQADGSREHAPEALAGR